MTGTAEPAAPRSAPRAAVRELLAPVRWPLRAAVCAQAVASVLLLSPVVTGTVLARLLLEDPADERVWTVLTIGSGLLGLGVLFRGAADLIAHLADNRLTRSLRRDLVEHLGSVPLAWFTDTTAGEVKQSAQDDVRTLHHLVAHRGIGREGTEHLHEWPLRSDQDACLLVVLGEQHGPGNDPNSARGRERVERDVEIPSRDTCLRRRGSRHQSLGPRRRPLPASAGWTHRHDQSLCPDERGAPARRSLRRRAGGRLDPGGALAGAGNARVPRLRGPEPCGHPGCVPRAAARAGGPPDRPGVAPVGGPRDQGRGDPRGGRGARVRGGAHDGRRDRRAGRARTGGAARATRDGGQASRVSRSMVRRTFRRSPSIWARLAAKRGPSSRSLSAMAASSS